MATRTITIHDRCTKAACGRVLHNVAEAERGVCAACWWKEAKPETKRAMNQLIAAAFNGSNEQQKDVAVDGALSALKAEKQERTRHGTEA